MQMWVCVVDRSRGNKHDILTAKFWEWQMHLNVGVNYIKKIIVCVYRIAMLDSDIATF